MTRMMRCHIKGPWDKHRFVASWRCSQGCRIVFTPKYDEQLSNGGEGRWKCKVAPFLIKKCLNTPSAWIVQICHEMRYNCTLSSRLLANYCISPGLPHNSATTSAVQRQQSTPRRTATWHAWCIAASILSCQSKHMDTDPICNPTVTEAVFKRLLKMLTGHFAAKPTRGQSSRRLVNSWTSQLANSNLLKTMERLH